MQTLENTHSSVYTYIRSGAFMLCNNSLSYRNDLVIHPHYTHPHFKQTQLYHRRTVHRIYYTIQRVVRVIQNRRSRWGKNRGLHGLRVSNWVHVYYILYRLTISVFIFYWNYHFHNLGMFIMF